MFAPTAPLDWQDRAACNEVNPDTMFPGRHDRRGIEEAKAVCDGCLVRTTCLTWAKETGQEHGVWGGVDEDTRKRDKRNEQRRESRRRAKEAASASAAA